MDWILFVWFFLGVLTNELARRISKALHEHKWACPQCSLVFRTSDKDFLEKLKASHTHP